MIWFLRILFATIFGSMLWVTSWASMDTPLFSIPDEVLSHPWFIASLFDAYWGFVTFYVWAAWKERGTAARVLWFIAVMLLGNLAMSVYFLRELFAVEEARELHLVFTRRNPGRLSLPLVLVILSATVYFLAWMA